MSIELVALCWKKQFANHAERDVMVALCDHANDDGVCWPSQAHIAWKMDRHPDTVKACLKKFRARGLIETRKEANNDLSKSPVIRVLPHKLADKPARETGGRETPRGEGRENPPDPGAGDPPKPSVEPPSEPSTSPKGSGEPKKDRITLLVDRCREVDFEPTPKQKDTWANELGAKARKDLRGREFMRLVNLIAQAGAEGYFWSFSRAEREAGKPRGKSAIGPAEPVDERSDEEKANPYSLKDYLDRKKRRAS